MRIKCFLTLVLIHANIVSRTDQEKLRDVQRDLIYGEAMQHRDHDSAYGVDSTW